MNLLESAFDLKGRVAIVTGGSRGIGRAVVLRLAEAGCNVVVNYVENEAAATETTRKAREAGVAAVAMQADVTRVDEASRLVSDAIDRFGRVDVLVCNAGLWLGAPVEDMSEELWDRVVDTSLKGTWALCRAAVPSMKRARFGRIVIISSTAGQRGEAGYANYAAAKGGQLAFMRSLAVELGPFGINVNAVAPGWVDTEMTADVLGDPVRLNEIEREIPIGRVATVDDIALPVLFLASGWSRHINGEVVSVNGGSVLCG